MNKIATGLILCFMICKPGWVLADNDEVWERLFTFQRTMAEQGDSEAMLILGDMYRKGEGTDIDANIALYWYNQAARAGNKKAEDRIEQLLKQKDDEKQAPKSAARTPGENQKHVPSKQHTSTPDSKKPVQDNKKAIELANARKKAQQLAAQLAREREEAEKARMEMERLKGLEQQLAQERAAAEKARRDMEALKSRQLQLIQERKAAEQARIEAENARLEQEQTAQNTVSTSTEPVHTPEPVSHVSPSPGKAERTNVNSFKSNPCDDQQVRNSYSCQLLNRRH